ncbi:uncharacterized protein LOC115778125 isoform X2 [Archocentrus centrarchus]|uniref:uncharacterized protein LOC115778125 isoform X2 n=1 Tax=Archocentrus centrarchus TaxID=63155 RepID=UPI0011E9C95D|nr:uncharacterized protein LOC115778125 isoform X2 [Archocentrus centrarchus]
MSAELLSVSQQCGNNGNLQGTTVGGAKPIHRFLKGQPKILGTIVLILGASFFIFSIVITADSHLAYTRTVIPPGFLMGSLVIICGIMYVLTEHNPTKKTVTISLSLSIVSILVTCWALLQILPEMEQHHYEATFFYDYENYTESEEEWSANHKHMGLALEAVFVFYTLVGAVILIVMSALAGAALRSTKTQAVVMMTTASTETPTE